MVSPTPQSTDFSIDVLGRYVCNGLDEALRSADKGALRPDGSSQADARPFDVVVIGGGSFGAIFAQHLLYKDKSHSHRILVLEAGRLALPEHVQNLPMLGLNVPPPTTVDPGKARNEVWGLPWRTDVPAGFPGLAYCLGGRSVFFGGWSPELLAAETPPSKWPASVLSDLRNLMADGSPGYFRQASEQLGVNQTNDFIFGGLHTALRKELFDAINASKVSDAIALASLPLNIDDVPPGSENLFKLEAPLAVQARPPRSGSFLFNKFSSVPLVIEATRAAFNEAGGDDVKKRLMVVPNCHVTRFETTVTGGVTRVSKVFTSLGDVSLPENGVVIIALGTIESARLALTSFPLIANAGLIGQNLMAHLRSNLTIRIPRSALPAGLPNELQASALFVKGKHTHGDGTVSHFHLQITAAGLDRPGTDSEAELFKKIPDIDLISSLRRSNDDNVVITIRGIGEMEPLNPNNHVTLSGEMDEYTLPRAFVTINPTGKDATLWNAMDTAADDVALAFANGKPYEVLYNPPGNPTEVFEVAAGHLAVEVLAFGPRRDGLGTTHHEAGTLRMGDTAATSVTNSDGRFHHVDNAYAAGPALFPTVGSPNPMLTGTALARRLGDHLALKPSPIPDPGFQMLFNGSSTDNWRMSTIKNQPGRDSPGRFLIVDGTLEALPGTDIGLFWCTDATPADFILKLEWLRWQENDNSGVFVRFPNPKNFGKTKGYNNTAYIGVDYGFEVQIDQAAAPDGAAIHKTAAVYNFAAPINPNSLPVLPPGEWNKYEIRVQGQDYTVFLNGTQVTTFNFTVGSDPLHPERGLPSTAAASRYIGLQTHTGRVAFRNIQIKKL